MRCGASQKKPLRDSTHSTALSGLIFWDVPQIAAYREKLKWVANTKVERRIIPMEMLYPTLVFWAIRVVKLQTEVET